MNGTCLSLVSDWSCRNYAHFLLDALGRLAVLDEAGISLSEVDQIYCPRRRVPQRRASSTVSASRLKRIFAAPGLLLSAERLLVPSRPATALTFPAWLPAFLRRAVRARSAAPTQRRLYVSRRGFERRSSSEHELERVVRERGFEVYEAGARPTQPEDFDEATFIVGAHGAGLANLAFCRPGTRVLEIVPTDNAHPFYYSLAVGAGLDYAYIVRSRASSTARPTCSGRVRTTSSSAPRSSRRHSTAGTRARCPCGPDSRAENQPERIQRQRARTRTGATCSASASPAIGAVVP